jgi:methionine-gamma-lyase
MDKNSLKSMCFETQTIHGGYHKNEHGALVSPIYQTSTFMFDTAEQGGRRFAGEEQGYIYTRLGNPSNTAVEEKLALLEGAQAAMSMASGMGAVSSAIWSAVQAGDHIIAAKTLYGCTYAFLSHGVTKFGVEVTFVDTTNPQNVKDAMKSNTKVVYLETPANPTLDIADITAISAIAHENEGCLVMVDNTFCTPYLQRPIELGADVVLHSATKYLNGHGDVIAGFVVGTQEFIDKVRYFGVKDMTGSTLSPFDAFLIARGMKTLHIRMERHCENAMQVAKFLQGHPAVKSVIYTGFEDHPQYELIKKQMRFPGAMISFEINGDLEKGKQVMNSVELCVLAVSLGDAETLIQHPASMTHSPYTEEERKEAGISEGLIRLSVGLENPHDIIADLDRALNTIL